MGVTSIELSGGNYEPDWLATISKYQGVELSFHNYFPPPETSFVFNLASSDSDIRLASVNMCKQGIRLSSEFGQKIFSFHAGFCFDPAPDTLGGQLRSESPILDNASALDLFHRSLDEILPFSGLHGVTPLVENNVLNTATALNFGQKALLLTTGEEIAAFCRHWGSDIGVLLDVGHLKVSCFTIGHEFLSELEIGLPFAGALHLHSNDGKEDQHLGVTGTEEWWERVQTRGEITWTFEVKPSEIKQTIDGLGLI